MRQEYRWLIGIVLLCALLVRRTPAPPDGSLRFTITRGQFFYSFALDGDRYVAAYKGREKRGALSADAVHQLWQKLDAAGAWSLPNTAPDVGLPTYTLQGHAHAVVFSGSAEPRQQAVLNVLTDSVVFRAMEELTDPDPSLRGQEIPGLGTRLDGGGWQEDNSARYPRP